MEDPPLQEMKLLNDREVQIVDTTCPWVSKVWTAVDNQLRKGHTSVIHGKWAHEETIATASFAGAGAAVGGAGGRGGGGGVRTQPVESGIERDRPKDTEKKQ